MTNVQMNAIEQFREELMERQTARDQQHANMRELYEERRRKKKCTNCASNLYRGHFHSVGHGHSVCCSCVSKVQASNGIKSLYGTRAKIKTKKK